MTKPFVAILMGSDSDLDVMQNTIDVLQSLDISFEAKISSAHRTPQQTIEYIHQAEQRGCQIFIAAAGLAAHLAGTVAAHTTKPVIGVPLDAGTLHGMDALLATVQMPGGIPVASMAIGKPGAKNAAYFAAAILATHDVDLAQRLQAMRAQQTEQVQAKDQRLQQKLQSTVT